MNEKREYYEAYDDRYKQVHEKQLRWFADAPSPIVGDIMKKYGITKTMNIAEIGCGEGRDAVPLLRQGYRLLATDISAAAIDYCKNNCPEHTRAFMVLDCLTDSTNHYATFDFIYAVAVLHMLVLDSHRTRFFRFIYEQLSETGVALICTMGDGSSEHRSDISTAFELQPRTHGETGETLCLAGTSFRMVNFAALTREIEESGLTLVESGITAIEPDYPVVMFAVVSRGAGNQPPH